MKKIIILAVIAVVFILVFATVFFTVRINQLSGRLSQLSSVSEAMQTEIIRLEQERSQLAQERNKLQADMVSYLSVKTNLQEQARKAKEELNKAYLAIDNKEAELANATLRLEELEKKLLRDMKAQRETIMKEKDALIQQVHSLKDVLNRERGLYYYNLGVTQAIAGLYEDAVKSYEKSLEFNSGNPDTHYNLGLLYEKIMRDFRKAVICYRKYLELYPQAPDKREIELLIEEFLLSEARPLRG